MSLKDGRSVARPLQNLGSTCFVNCVLQALAHAPELCMAMMVESHSKICPIAAENIANTKLLLSSSVVARSASPNETGTGSSSTVGIRKSSRTVLGRKSSGSSNTGNGGGSGDSDSKVINGSSGDKLGDVVGDGGAAASAATGGHLDPKFCVLSELEQHFVAVHDSVQKDRPLAPSTFVHGFFKYIAPWFKLGVQEDAHEFLRLLIDAMQKACRVARLQNNPQDDSTENHPERFPTSTSTSTSTITSTTDVDKEYPFSLFRGMVESKVLCSACNACSETLDPIEDVGLDVSMEMGPEPERVGRNTSSSPLPAHSLLDLKSAFCRFSREEHLEGYKCETCGRLSTSTKQTRLASIPPILTLHIKRFRYGDSRVAAATAAATATAAAAANSLSQSVSGGASTSAIPGPNVTTRSSRIAARNSSDLNLSGQSASTATDVPFGKSGPAKIEGHVKFDLLIDLKPYLTPEKQESEKGNMFCRLFAVVVHAGKNSHSGHYLAFVKSLNRDEWWKMDDGRVTLVDKSEVLAAEAYMLFYRVLQHPVAVALSDAYERKLSEPDPSLQVAAEEIASGNASTVAGTVALQGITTARDPNKKRARIITPYQDGEEWARAKAPRLVGVASRAQQIVAEALELTNDFLQRIHEEVAETVVNGTNGGADDPTSLRCLVGPTKNKICEDDVQGGVEAVRAKLSVLFYRLSQHFHDDTKGNGASTSSRVSFFEDSSDSINLSRVSSTSVNTPDPTSGKAGVAAATTATVNTPKISAVKDATDVL